MALPESIPGFVVEAGRAVGRDLPPLDAREVLGPWKEVLGKRGPFFVRLRADDSAVVAHTQRLSRLGELWLDTPLRNSDDALDLLVAGASRLLVPTADRDGDLLEAVGPSAIIDWNGSAPWADVQAIALEHAVPVLASRSPPDDAACDVYVPRGQDAKLSLLKIASAPAGADAAAAEADEDEPEAA